MWSFWKKGDPESNEDAEWEKKEEEKDKKREEDLKNNKEKEAEKKLPNTVEELLGNCLYKYSPKINLSYYFFNP